MKKSIKDLIEGEKAIISSCEDRKLLENGFVEGTPIEVYKKIYGITCVYIRGAIVAARDKEYEKVNI
ncbi:hypothetical protein CO037_01060 [Candidatus Pacearchaeota archaeon CG_4_9_14_0_2_um_filter_30_8]|nr:MAG: hypothetical protein CO037_01060 [Candidatus Pacearchaeota archaeon CG_4_9_14_0_2_um_filter_30_8]